MTLPEILLFFAFPETRPNYAAEGIVNAAHAAHRPLAPNTIASIYGERLSYSTQAVGPDDLIGNTLPTVIARTGTRVVVGGIPAPILYVSPSQINFLLPANLLPGVFPVEVFRDGVASSAVAVVVRPAAPAFFEQAPDRAVALHADGSLVTPERPGRPGEVVVLYLTGLGATVPTLRTGELARQAAPLQDAASVRVQLAGVPLAPELIRYLGAAPGFAGLYQLNLKLPDEFPPDPEIRLSLRDETSPASVLLYAQQ